MAGGTAEFTNQEAAGRASPLASRLFGVEGVTGVYLGADFVSVSKAEGQEWHRLKPAVLGAIMEHYLSGDPVVNSAALAADSGKAGPAGGGGRDRPAYPRADRHPGAAAVARDGGDIVYHGFERGIVYLTMHGACSGCPSSIVTLRNGIENLLRYYVPEVVEVRAVD